DATARRDRVHGPAHPPGAGFEARGNSCERRGHLMMSVARPSFLQIKLLSDATFSRGEGTAGVVDIEVEHDEFGMPFIGGQTVRGLLRDSWLSMFQYFPELEDEAKRVLGQGHAVNES